MAKLRLFWLVAALTGQCVAPAQTNGAENKWKVLLGSDGTVRFAPVLNAVIEYTDTGLVITDEARQYPEAIEQLLADDKEFVPVQWKVAKARMTDFLAWEQVREADLVLIRNNNGQTLDVRPPATETERKGETITKANPFGLLATIVFALTVFGNLLIRIKADDALADAAAVVAAVAAVVAAAAAVAAIAAAVAAAAAAVAVVAVVAATVVVAAAAAIAVDYDKKTYRGFSLIATTLMMAAVGLAIMGW